MRRIFGSKKPKQKRLSPSARTPEGIVASHPMYQYAMNEYAQTVAPQSSNHDGRTSMPLNDDADLNNPNNGGNASAAPAVPPEAPAPLSPSMLSAHDMQQMQAANAASAGPGAANGRTVPPISHTGSMMSDASMSQQQQRPQQQHQTYQQQQKQQQQQQQYPQAPSSSYYPYMAAGSRHCEVMPDATYEESYGDAYVGGPIRYIYPSGYQSMRPRGCPWKLSIAVCASFTWLSIFIIGHCSSRVDAEIYNEKFDDDVLVFKARWCDSRPLYMMWVISMLITGLAAAYCSIIGYIKVRDFSVANARSQPPGMMGKSDYYVKLDDTPPSGTGSEASYRSNVRYKKTIYQADGNPQFWGGHIYRPTQAAVAITSR